ncbi:MAG: hypothetical protein LRY71_00395 [Bacillaceae bacterium]|nr:hypothetical protein [Bacillaceae bacterium]
MSAITFLASSKPFIIPDEIEEFNNRTFSKKEYFGRLWVHEVEANGWLKCVDGLFTMPYIYEISDANSQLFLLYLEKYMEEGDVLELVDIPNQHAFEWYKQRLLDDPVPIIINVGSFTYQNGNQAYQLNPKRWVEELSRKNYVTQYGVTTIVKY